MGRRASGSKLQRLKRAVMRNDLDEARRRLSNPVVPINQCFLSKFNFYAEQESLLHLACRLGLVKMVSLLLEKEHLDVNNTTNTHHTPLYTACLNERTEIVELLLQDERVDHNIPCKLTGQTPFYRACKEKYHDIGKVFFRLRSSPALNTPCKESSTPMRMACERDAVGLYFRLVEAGVNPDLPCFRDKHPLQEAFHNRSWKVFSAILIDPRSKTSPEMFLKLMKSSAERGNNEEFQFLVTSGLLRSLHEFQPHPQCLYVLDDKSRHRAVEMIEGDPLNFGPVFLRHAEHYYDMLYRRSAILLAFQVFLSDEFFKLDEPIGQKGTGVYRFFQISKRLPFELQNMLALKAYRLPGSAIPQRFINKGLLAALAVPSG